MESIEARLDKIENQNRQLKLLSFILLVVFAGGIFWISRTHIRTPGILTAHQLLLVDDAGRTRGGLALGPDGPFLSLRDADGKERVLIGLGNGPHFTLRDSSEVGRIVLGVVSTGPGLMMYDDQGQARAQLDVGKNGPRLYFENQFGSQATVRKLLCAWKRGSKPKTESNDIRFIPKQAGRDLASALASVLR